MKKILLGILLLFISFGGYSQRAAEFKNGITIQKEEVLASKFVSYGESYINNWRDLVLDDGATYFPNNGGYEIGRLHQAEINTSLHFIPAAVGEGVLYSLGENRTNDFNVERASFATFVGHGGIITTADFHVARIDYTDGDGAILAEDESTNLIERSETFDHGSGYWILSGATLTSGFSAPDDTTNAYKLVEDGTNGRHQIRTGFVTFTATDYTFSVIAKAAERNWIFLESGNTTTFSGRAFFDLTNGVVGLVTAGTASIVSLADGWYLCSVSGAATAAQTQVKYNIADGDNSPDYQGDGTSGIYIFGSQLEAQSYATSYIKSDSGSSTTRLKDVITSTSSVFDRGIDNFSVYMEFELSVINEGDQFLLYNGAAGTGAGFSVVYSVGNNAMRFFMQSSSSSSYSIMPLSDFDVNTMYKMMITINRSGNVTGYLDGVERLSANISSNTGSIDFSGTTTLLPSSSPFGDNDTMKLSAFIIYDTALTPAQAIELTK